MRPRGDGLTRRELLEAAIAASAGMLVHERLGGLARAVGRRVIVIGAGFAGLTAAHELHGSGYDVIVVEARRRAGGRVLTLRDFVKGGVVEGGGELIGSNHLTWVALARHFTLPFVDVADGEPAFVFDGRRLSSSEEARARSEYETARQRLNADARRIEDPLRPWTASGAEALDRRSLAMWLETQRDLPLGARALAARMAADNGVATSWQSLLAVLSMVGAGGVERYWTDSEIWRCAGGNDRLAHKLVAAVGPQRVRLGTPAASIRVTDSRVTIGLRDGTELEGDDVVLAIPPSVWQRVSFDPPLPPNLQPQMGRNVKFLMALDSPLWSNAAPSLLSDGPVQVTWEGATRTARGATALVAFSGGPAADVCRAWTAREREAQFYRHLAPVVSGLARATPRARFMDWSSDPWTNASYSFPAPGQVTTIGPILSEGLGRLHFAGEHVGCGFFGYMEGALRSGMAAAHAIAQRDGVISGRERAQARSLQE